MLNLFQKSCEDIVGEPFKGSYVCLLLSGVLIFLFGAFGAVLIKNMLFALAGLWGEVFWLGFVIFPAVIALYYGMIVLWAWAYRKAGFGLKRS